MTKAQKVWLAAFAILVLNGLLVATTPMAIFFLSPFLVTGAVAILISSILPQRPLARIFVAYAVILANGLLLIPLVAGVLDADGLAWQFLSFLITNGVALLVVLPLLAVNAVRDTLNLWWQFAAAAFAAVVVLVLYLAAASQIPVAPQ